MNLRRYASVQCGRECVGRELEKSLTSFELPAVEIGANAARMEIEEIEAPKDHKPGVQHLMLNASISERESS